MVKRILSLLTIVFGCFVNQPVYSKIMCATKWMNGSKNVYLYYDSHLGEAYGQRDYLKTRILHMAPRKKQLDILLECYQGELIHALRDGWMDDGSLLNFLADYTACDFGNGVNVSSVEPREFPVLFHLHICKGNLSDSLKKSIENVSLLDVMMRTSAMFYFFKAWVKDNKVAQGIIVELFKKYAKEQEKLNKMLSDMGLADCLARPVLTIRGNRKFLSLLFSEYFMMDHFTPAMEAMTVSRIVNSPGDVAIVTGFSHAIHAEEYLRKMGYAIVESANELQLGLARFLTSKTDTGVESGDKISRDETISSLLESIKREFYVEYSRLSATGTLDLHALLVSLPEVSTSAFDWMLG
jgi:hypothetical protein